MSATLCVLHATDTLTHVELIGALDVASTRSIELKFTASTAARHRPLIVDMSQVTFLASTGIGMLVQVARTLGLDKHPLVLLAPTDAIAGVIRQSRLDSLLQIAATLDEAMTLVKIPVARA